MLQIEVRMDGVRQTLRAFRDLGRDASGDLREESVKIATGFVPRMQAAARADGPQSALMAPTVRVKRDRVPSVQAGGGKRVGRHKKPAGALIYASEFGMNSRSGWYGRVRYRQSRGRQWHPHRGAASYWFHRTADRQMDSVYRQWFAVVDRLIRRWASG
jgi:hypothetical protein